MKVQATKSAVVTKLKSIAIANKSKFSQFATKDQLKAAINVFAEDIHGADCVSEWANMSIAEVITHLKNSL